MNKIRLLYLLLSFLSLSPLFAQNKKNAQSLLWRITGNGLTKPSYLYGTVHLRNKQLFNFGDSLYKSLETVDGFAMELDPEVLSSAVADNMEKVEAKVLVREKLNKSDFGRLNKKLRKEYGIDAENMTVKEFHQLKEKLILPEGSPEDMSTFMDAYLYSIAKGQGKTVVGLEDIRDQMDEPGETEYDVHPKDVKRLFQQVEIGRSYVQQMLKWYREQNIEMLQLYSQMGNDEHRDTIFRNRNHKMAYRFDSLIRQNESYFVAVGAAHLAGDNGVISLMNKKGYTVEPVYSSKQVPAGTYIFKKAALKWQEYSDPSLGFSIMMPGKPSPSEMLNGDMKMRMYYDLANGMLYYASFVRSAIDITEQNKDSIYRNMVSSSLQKGGELISEKKIDRLGLHGVEVFFNNKVESMFVKMQLLGKGRKMYMLMIAAQKKEALDSLTGEYFDSFKLLPDQPLKWTVIPSEIDAFKMAWPKEPEMTKVSGETVDPGFDAKRYMSVIDKDGIYLFLLVLRTIENYVILNDSLYFDGVLQNMKLQEYDTISSPELFIWKGYPGMKLQARSSKAPLMIKLRYILRGNRVYTAMAMYEKEKEQDPQIDQFLNSLEFTAFPDPVFHEVSSPSSDFIAELPVDVIRDKTDSLELHSKTYYAYDSLRATTYTVTSKKLSGYLWAKSDTSFLRKQMETSLNDDDVLINHHFTLNGKSKAIDFSIKVKNSNLIHRARIILHGRNMYSLESRVTDISETTLPVNHFFETFRPVKETGDDITKATPGKLFNDLRSSDSLTYESAYDALGEISFEEDEIPMLFKEALHHYQPDTLHYQSVNDVLFDKLVAMNAPAVLPLVKENYFSLGAAGEKFKYKLLRLLSSLKTREAYQLISELTASGLPKEGNAASFLYPMHDSLALAKTIYPSLSKHLGDSLLSMPLSYLQLAMLDSSMMKLTDIFPYRKQWIGVAMKRIEEMKKSESEYAGTFDTDICQLLLLYKDKEANNAVAGFLPLKPVNLKKFVAIGLLKNGVPLLPEYAEQIAADKYHRIAFYEELVETGNEKRFPVRWFNQKSFAEAYLFGSFEDEEPAKVIPLGYRTAMFKGKKQRFYLYKLVFEYDEETASYLGISGPFDLKASGVLSVDPISGTVAEAFDQSKISEHFRNYLSEFGGSSSED